MILIFGGAYQGKLDYAKRTFGADKTVFHCRENTPAPDFGRAIIASYHLLVLAQMRKGIDPCAYLDAHWGDLRGKIILCDDISCGVVPMAEEDRKWREATGRCMGKLSEKAERVVRVFCGIGMRLK